ncbi:putative CRISPR-associated protein, Cas3` and Cas3`` domain protein [Candidatus Nitrososphaera gargensis Ga9.2]|uniref:Putative CRISPR-associated protein, Cas3` and Cas3`` domain protein n=1 Tax=Nitrososphaera gargensis (strain Ga9.2) TaxID=1237085 RepID=K0IHP1_NITGG|nr:CRISPR-associated helicase Cas3' [Candidatus Nitrososphaera gargensis]AFU57332.1 putative CRISPR-associated protein, Cas3` and Cas3`` domain protein [Candidatus Nitrososphaera gargensis Ga9.2]
MYEWSELDQKLSHQGKTLLTHINEVKALGKDLLDFYGLNKEYHEILDYLAEYHDYGKRSNKWSINNDKNPPHSPLSVRYCIDNKCYFKEDTKLTNILWYLIFKHHGSLGDVIRDYNGVKPFIERRIIEKRIKELDFDHRVNLIDTFGLFKVADALSASNLQRFKMELPEVNEGIVKRIIGSVDARWNEQLRLSSLPSFGMLKAYTGWGKTSASLIFFMNKNASKIFYLFPTISAINQFYEKLNKEVGEKARKYFYFYDAYIEEPSSGASEDLDLVGNTLLTEYFLCPYIITTIDQFLLSFLQNGKYYRKRVMFRNAGIVLDEIHLLNPLMLTILVYFLKKYRQVYNLKFLAMSATFSSALKGYLSKELRLGDDCWLNFDEGFRRKRRIMFEYKNDDIEKHLDYVNSLSSKKVLIIANTVEKAVAVARKLDEMKKPYVLLHGRFMYRDRVYKEKKIEELKRNPHVLIATQVCEVSLDVSYDFMMTELSPVPSLIQRFGRVNRYGGRINETNVLIFRPDIKNEKYYPYSQDELKAFNEIEKFQGSALENEKQLIDQYDRIYTYDLLQKGIDRVYKEISFGSFEEILEFFFSLSYSEEELMRIMSYRESFTTLIIPHHECIDPGEKEKIAILRKALGKNMKTLDYGERNMLFREIKSLAVSVPIWWLKGLSVEEKIVCPVINFRDKVYNSTYGFVGRGS